MACSQGLNTAYGVSCFPFFFLPRCSRRFNSRPRLRRRPLTTEAFWGTVGAALEWRSPESTDGRMASRLEFALPAFFPLLLLHLSQPEGLDTKHDTNRTRHVDTMPGMNAL